MPTTVHITDQGNQTISGVKTFDVFPIVSGNKLITGVDLSSYLTSSTASSTYATITNLASTGSTLVGSITSLSGLFTGYTGALDATFASDTQLYTTGSTLDSKINSLSGNLTSTYATITNLTTTGSTLDTKINNLSGYVNSSGSNIVFTTGNQSISGVKNFASRPTFSGIQLLVNGDQGASYASLFLNTVNLTAIPISGLINSIVKIDRYPPDGLARVSLPFGNNQYSGQKTTIMYSPNGITGDLQIEVYNNNPANGLASTHILSDGESMEFYRSNVLDYNSWYPIPKDRNTLNSVSQNYATLINLASTGSTLNSNINSLSGLFTGFTGNLDTVFASDAQLYTTGSTLDTKINNLSGYVNSSSSNIVYTTGNQTIAGNKNFTGDINLTGNNNRIGRNDYIEVEQDWVYIKKANGNIILSSEEFSLFDTNQINSVAWADRKLFDSNSSITSLDWNERYLANKLGQAVLYWTGDNIGIGTNTPTEKLQVDGNIRINDGGGLYIYDQPNDSDHRMIWQDNDLLFELNFNNFNSIWKQVGFTFNNGPLGETSLYNFKVALGSQPSILYIPSGRQGYIAINEDLVATGSNLNNKINNVSGYINSSSSNIVFTTGNQIIYGVKTIEDLKTQNLSLNDLVGGNSGITFKLNDGDLQVSNKSGVMFGLSNLSASPFTGLNNIVLTSDNTTIKLPPNKNDFIAMSSEVVYNTGNQTISGVKTFNNGLSTSRISGIFGSTLNIIAGSGVGASSINASDLILIGGSLSGVSPNILKTGASITLGGAKTTATADITIRPSVDQNASAGNIILEAGLSTTYNGKINMFGDINVNGTSDLGTALSSKNINIYRRGDFFGSPSQRLAISIDNNNANFQNGMGLQVSGVQVTPALYATSANLASTGSNLNTQIENAKKLAIAYAIAL